MSAYLPRSPERSFPDVAGVEDVAVVVVGVEVAGVVVVLGAVDVVVAVDVVAGADDAAVALVVVTGEELVVVVVVLLPFPAHPIKSPANKTRVREIPKTFFIFYPLPVLDFPQ